MNEDKLAVDRITNDEIAEIKLQEFESRLKLLERKIKDEKEKEKVLKEIELLNQEWNSLRNIQNIGELRIAEFEQRLKIFLEGVSF